MTAKDGTNAQWGLVSADGTRATAGQPGAGNSDGVPPLVDEQGRVWVRGANAPPPIPTFETLWQEASGGVNDAEIRGQIDPANQFILSQVSGFIEAAADTDVNYVQLFNRTGAPNPGDTPEVSIRIVGTQNYSWSPGQWLFDAGIRWAISTTANTYTAGTAALGRYSALGWEHLP
jgi:hypothetical protein